jgi:hypothetical protein
MLAEYIHNDALGKISRTEYFIYIYMTQEGLDNVTLYLIIFLDYAIAF